MTDSCMKFVSARWRHVAVRWKKFFVLQRFALLRWHRVPSDFYCDTGYKTKSVAGSEVLI